ncbi:MAG: hypothetical protein ACRCW1_05115 [Anaerotignaceae bacterium]
MERILCCYNCGYREKRTCSYLRDEVKINMDNYCEYHKPSKTLKEYKLVEFFDTFRRYMKKWGKISIPLNVTDNVVFVLHEKYENTIVIIDESKNTILRKKLVYRNFVNHVCVFTEIFRRGGIAFYETEQYGAMPDLLKTNAEQIDILIEELENWVKGVWGISE